MLESFINYMSDAFLADTVDDAIRQYR